MYVQDLMENFICPKINRVRDLIGMYNLKNNIPVAKLTAKKQPNLLFRGNRKYLPQSQKKLISNHSQIVKYVSKYQSKRNLEKELVMRQTKTISQGIY